MAHLYFHCCVKLPEGNLEVRENISPSQVSVAATTVRAQADE